METSHMLQTLITDPQHVGGFQINSLASSGFTEQHAHRASSSEEQTLPAVFQAATPSADFNCSCLAIAINSRPVTARAPPQAPHCASGYPHFPRTKEIRDKLQTLVFKLKSLIVIYTIKLIYIYICIYI
jgi:hypothetical protein